MAATKVRFWLDPACPWCWVSSQWVRSIAAERQLEVEWNPISLLIKNDTQPDSPFYDTVVWTYGLLRVLESVRAGEGDAAVGPLYREFGRRIHNNGERMWDPALALKEVGLDARHAAAADDASFDAELLRRHHEALALVGDDVGTPIISVVGDDGIERALFGPVISKVPATKQDALALWDAVMVLRSIPEFWELKRTRTVAPEFIVE